MRRDYEITCLMCAREVGWIVDGRLHAQSGRAGSIPRRHELLRCDRCGGSVYLEAIPTGSAPVSLTPVSAERDLVSA